MSARFWLFSLACTGTALTGGYGLGIYATTPPRAGVETPLPQMAAPQSAPYDMTGDMAGLTGPAIIQCKGCGPTLADRQMAADRAGWDGMQDPVVRDYAAQEESGQSGYAAPVPLEGTEPAPAERFAESEDSWGPVRVAQAPHGQMSAEETPADTISY